MLQKSFLQHLDVANMLHLGFWSTALAQIWLRLCISVKFTLFKPDNIKIPPIQGLPPSVSCLEQRRGGPIFGALQQSPSNSEEPYCCLGFSVCFVPSCMCAYCKKKASKQLHSCAGNRFELAWRDRPAGIVQRGRGHRQKKGRKNCCSCWFLNRFRFICKSSGAFPFEICTRAQIHWGNCACVSWLENRKKGWFKKIQWYKKESGGISTALFRFFEAEVLERILKTSISKGLRRDC